jgi:UrcA family protein
MSSRNLSRAATVLGLALSTALCSSAVLADMRAAGTSAVSVRYTHDELGTIAGASHLYARIRGAARSVCGDSGRTLGEQRLWRRCYRATMDAAVAQVHSTLLESVHLEAVGRQRRPVTVMLRR